jgi:hypothetical protein
MGSKEGGDAVIKIINVYFEEGGKLMKKTSKSIFVSMLGIMALLLMLVPGAVQAQPWDVLWWDSTPEYGGQAPDALRQEMCDFLTNFGGGGTFNCTYVSSMSQGTFSTHMMSNSYDVIVFDSTGGSSFNTADLAAVTAHYTAHPNVLLEGLLYIRSINYNATTNFPGINGSTGGFTVNEVYQLAQRGGGAMIGTDHNCCQAEANQILGAMIPGAAFSGVTYPSLDGQFNGDDLLDTPLVVVSASDIFAHWDSVPTQAITPTGMFTDINGNPVELFSQVDVADDPGGGTQFPYISTSWEPGGTIIEFDCNNNGVLDSIDISNGTSDDCDLNGIPDECEPDCNMNGTTDACDIIEGTSQDCNENEVPDTCDINDGTSQDADQNSVPDECEAQVQETCDVDANGAGTSRHPDRMIQWMQTEMDRSQ